MKALLPAAGCSEMNLSISQALLGLAGGENTMMLVRTGDLSSSPLRANAFLGKSKGCRQGAGAGRGRRGRGEESWRLVREMICFNRDQGW